MAKGECPACNTPNEYTEVCCSMCGQRLPWAPAQAAAPSPVATPAQVLTSQPQKPFLSADTSGLPRVGAFFMVIGIACVVYFMFFFDTTVAVPSFDFMGTSIGGGRVNNIGLLATRQNGIIGGFGSAIFGAILFFLGQKKG